MMHRSFVSVGSLVFLAITPTSIGFRPVQVLFSKVRNNHLDRTIGSIALANDESSALSDVNESTAPALNGKRVLPFKVLLPGLQGHKVPAVYAVLNSNYKRGSEGWYATEYVGVTQDLEASLQSHFRNHGEKKAAHVRALSFSFLEPNAMQDVAQQWRNLARSAGSNIEANEWTSDTLEYLFDDNDDDDDDDWSMKMTANAMVTVSNSDGLQPAIVSPFESSDKLLAKVPNLGELTLNVENVDKVLDEVRPYLISDGGNVSVESVDEEKKMVYLKLQGACGSCASSTVTMQMGIERVLKEKFPGLKGVEQVQDEDPTKPSELTWQAVQDEVNRLKPAITAMGGVVEIISVDPARGNVQMKFRGANRVQQGVELAIRDLAFVNSVEFVMGE